MKNLHIFLLIYILSILTWAYIGAYDRTTWWLEAIPAILGLIALAIFYPKFKFTNFTLIMIALEMTILIIGSHYSYAKMPVFEYFKDVFHLERNYYDRLGHFTQGFVPALIAREVLIRRNVLTSGPWLSTFIVCFALSISAVYEIIEFIAANILGESADAFLGTQGDIWDTQWDMSFALMGAIIACLFFSRLQDRAIDKL